MYPVFRSISAFDRSFQLVSQNRYFHAKGMRKEVSDFVADSLHCIWKSTFTKRKITRKSGC